MAGTSLLALIDDVASILDDVALLTKVAARKTTGVLGDDLALNANQVAGLRADRELPVVWAVAKGSLWNKAILVPSALAISALAPFLVSPLLMAGGAYLCYEGFEKVAHRFLPHGPAGPAEAPPPADPALLERERIRGAVRTDFILSAEIVILTLGLVAQAPFATRVAVLAVIGVLMTAGVYGLVACIVKLDDLGLHLAGRRGRPARLAGEALLKAAPLLMKGLALAGTLAMFLVGGGIVSHGLHLAPPAHAALPGALVPLGVDLGTGLVVGATLLACVLLVRKVVSRLKRGARPSEDEA
jgi:uncharacterized protein